jgi:hypothetical protein
MTQKQMILGLKRDDDRFSGCNMFTTDAWAVTQRWQIIGPWRDRRKMWLPCWMVGRYDIFRVSELLGKLERCVSEAMVEGFARFLSLRPTSQPRCHSNKKFARGTIFLDTTILTCTTKVDLVLYKEWQGRNDQNLKCVSENWDSFDKKTLFLFVCMKTSTYLNIIHIWM